MPSQIELQELLSRPAPLRANASCLETLVSLAPRGFSWPTDEIDTSAVWVSIFDSSMEPEDLVNCAKAMRNALLGLRSDVWVVALMGSAEYYAGYVTADPRAVGNDIIRALTYSPGKPVTDVPRALGAFAARFAGTEVLKAITTFSDLDLGRLSPEMDGLNGRNFRRALELPGVVSLNRFHPRSGCSQLVERAFGAPLELEFSLRQVPADDFPAWLRRQLG